MFYVYEHWRPDTNTCFYVGKGSGNRAWNMRQRNKYHKSICKKLRDQGLIVEVRIIVKDLLEEAAFCVEKDRIALYGLDALANFTLGGEGFLGGRHTIESKAKISAASKKYVSENIELIRERFTGAKNPFYGKTHSPETRKRLSEKFKGVPPICAGAPTDEQKLKISATLKAKGIRPPSRQGATTSEEARKKQSAALKAYWARKKELLA